MRGIKGITMIGFLVLLVIVGALAIVAFRAIPIYSEFFTVKRILRQINVDAMDTTPAEIRKQFELKASADYVSDVKARDLDIGKEGSRIVISVTYQKTVPLVANVSLLFDFEASNRK